MIDNVILPDTKAADWAEIRRRMRARILETYGEGPVGLEPGKAQFEETRRYERHGLVHVELRYEVLPGEWNEGLCVLPQGMGDGDRAAAVLTIHGTNGQVGKLGMVDPEGNRERAYGLELARRGYVTMSVDQFGFGHWIKDVDPSALVGSFFEKFPNWSLGARRVLDHVRALDVLAQLDFVQAQAGFGAMGNSLGGSAVLELMAFDERVMVAAASTGVSPKITNVYRLINQHRLLCPRHSDQVVQTGRMPWEMNELLALCAPRALLVMEPFNDPYNPDIGATTACVLTAEKVWRLLGEERRLSMITHGDGHDTRPEVREYAYRWFERFLPAKAKP